MWKYVQRSGALIGPDGAVFHVGYSGRVPDGKNQPDKQCVRSVGPIPRGWWTLTAILNHPSKGAAVIRLTPDANTDVCGRAGFLIHGDNASGNASQGCIVICGADVRRHIWDRGDRRLLVVKDTVVVTTTAIFTAPKTDFL